MERIINDAANREMCITQMLDAPVDLVWEAWTNPEHIAAWWGPNGFTTTIHKMEIVAGGEWRLTMHSPEGKNYPNKSLFREIVAFEKIVFQHYNPNYIATINFKSEENKTLMECKSLFETAELFETVVKVFKADEGFHQNVEKLEYYLKKRMQ